MRAGPCNKKVALSQGPQATSGPFAPLSPENVWAAIEPLAPGGSDDRTTTHLVRTRYHAQVAQVWPHTRIAYVDARTGTTRYFFVRGLQSVNEAGDEMRLLCEEVTP